ncbi:MAG TPA: carbohydrate ABC transporter permease [Polyangiaceae bacterium]|nr:carbohydrate ABC transporter permease [Polyangiaceae bacterium]
MQPKTIAARIVVYALLVCGSALYLFPLIWLVLTSLKPVEQATALPPTLLPHAYTAVVNGQRMEVTRDFLVPKKSVLVSVNDGESAGKRLLLPLEDVDVVGARALLSAFENGTRRTRRVSVTILRTVDPGAWHVTERSETKVRKHELAWDVLPESEIAETTAPRWSNYPKALTTMGGREIEEVEGSMASRSSGVSEDTHVAFSRFLANTVIVCVLGVIGSVMSNAVVAYGLAKFHWRGKGALFAVTLATMMVPFPVLMVPLYGVFAELGMVGTLYPLWVPAFFGSAFNIFLMRQFFLTIPDELGEAARIDGCSEWGIFFRIVLPLSKPVLAVVALFHFLHAWNDFMGPLLYLTRKHTFTLAIALQNYQSQNGGVQWQYLMAASCVLILPIVILFLLAQKTFVRGIATTGIKG